jgi:hypothetical protein
MAKINIASQKSSYNKSYKSLGDYISPYLFIAPFLILLITFNLYVFISGAVTSLSDAEV